MSPLHTHTLSQDDAARFQVGDLPVIVVDGECNGHCGPRRDCCESPLDPPSWAVEASKPNHCLECHGGGDTSDGRPCWRCHGSGDDGRPVIELRGPCVFPLHRPGSGRHHPCGCDDGTVHLGYVTVSEVLSIEQGGAAFVVLIEQVTP